MRYIVLLERPFSTYNADKLKQFSSCVIETLDMKDKKIYLYISEYEGKASLTPVHEVFLSSLENFLVVTEAQYEQIRRHNTATITCGVPNDSVLDFDVFLDYIGLSLGEQEDVSMVQVHVSTLINLSKSMSTLAEKNMIISQEIKKMVGEKT